MRKKNTQSQKSDSSIPETAKRFNIISLFSSTTFWLKLIIMGQMVLLGLQFTPDISTNGDDAVYYILGKSLATGQGYRNIHLAGAPVSTSYPLVFPCFLAMTHFFTHTPLIAKILVACLGCIATLASFYLFRLWASWYLVPLLILISSLSVLNQHALELLSEIPYVVLTLLSLIFLEKSYKSPHLKGLFWITILLSILPMNCRSIGMAYSGAFIIANLLNKKYSYAIAHCLVLTASIVAFKMLTSWNTVYVLQLLQVNSYDPEQGYASLSEMIARVTANIGRYSSEILPEALLPSFVHAHAGIVRPLGVCLSLLIAMGSVRSLFLPYRLVGLYVVFYCGILSLWQVQWSSGRFLSGIMPFLLFLLFMGISTLWEGVHKIKNHTPGVWKALFFNNPLSAISKTHKAVLWCLAFLLMIDNTSYQVINADHRKQLSADWVNFFSCADWIRENTPKDAIVVSRKTEHVYVRSGRQGVLYSFSRDKEKVISDIKSSHASYIIVDNFFWTQTSQRYLYPALSAHPELYHIVYALRNPDTYVLQLANK
jgi:hypothetical protein